ncbi:MAG: zinc ribbon domain-containing protein [Atopobiaceae bacterium]|nr:zinc ribbon domain-containing protein [Atopobiaceae bacterium]
MGLLDEISNVGRRGLSAVNRTSESAKLKLEQSDLLKKRQLLAAQLGASLYEQTKDDPVLREGRDELYRGIEQIDERREAIELELAALDRQSAEAAQSSTFLRCPSCGSAVAISDVFCSGCGRSVAEIKEELLKVQTTEEVVFPLQNGGKTCPHCGAGVLDDDAFCMQCGKPLPESNSSEPVVEDELHSELAGEIEAELKLETEAGETEPELEPVALEAEAELEPVELEAEAELEPVEPELELEPEPESAGLGPEFEPEPELEFEPEPELQPEPQSETEMMLDDSLIDETTMLSSTHTTLLSASDKTTVITSEDATSLLGSQSDELDSDASYDASQVYVADEQAALSSLDPSVICQNCGATISKETLINSLTTPSIRYRPAAQTFF